MKYLKLFAILAGLIGYGLASEDDYQYQLMREKENVQRVRTDGKRTHIRDESSYATTGNHTNTDAWRNHP
jgi:hypothetical protein